MDPAKAVLDARLNRELDRRSFIKGVGGISALALLGPSALAACAATGSSQSPGATQAASPGTPRANLGGVLNFIGYEGEDAANVAGPFLKTNSITVQASYIADATEPLTKFQTGGRGQMDLIADNHNFYRGLLAEDVEFLAPLDRSRIPNAAGLFPALAIAPWVTKNDQLYSVPVIWGDAPVLYNPAKWDGAPAKYTDLEDPKYKGELVLADDWVHIWLFAVSLGYGPAANRLTQEQLDNVLAALLRVKPNVVTLATTLGDAADILVRGDGSMSLAAWAYQVAIARDKGVELAVATPAVDGTFYWCDSYAIAADAPNVDNAYAFIEYMSSPESNAAIATELGSGATIEAAYDLVDPAIRDLYPYDVVRSAEEGPLHTTNTLPPAEDEGDIVGLPKWIEAWERFKLG